jgi:hypothetical protein
LESRAKALRAFRRWQWFGAADFAPSIDQAPTDKSFLLLFSIVPKARLRHDKKALPLGFQKRSVSLAFYVTCTVAARTAAAGAAGSQI